MYIKSCNHHKRKVLLYQLGEHRHGHQSVWKVIKFLHSLLGISDFQLFMTCWCLYLYTHSSIKVVHAFCATCNKFLQLALPGIFSIPFSSCMYLIYTPTTGSNSSSSGVLRHESSAILIFSVFTWAVFKIHLECFLPVGTSFPWPSEHSYILFQQFPPLPPLPTVWSHNSSVSLRCLLWMEKKTSPSSSTF